ncbi:MAG: protein arginine kinase [Omnitrophica bacterium RBG_13_46_9]|nr:MAG: protein arginine kinase [Omnitrophica bacterium RBG_13_46_9]
MKLEDLLYKKSEWLRGTGPKSNIVISARIRLARNLNGFSFFNWAKPKEKEGILNTAKGAIDKSKFMKKSLFLSMKDLTEIDRQFLVERHLMSPEHVIDPEYKGLVIDDKEIVSIMVNEEDHLRIQVLQSGFNIIEAWHMCDEIDTDISNRVTYAFSSKWGYLTACPTNTGTGLRASVMLHLPALVMTNQIGKVFQAISKLGLTMRGFYGEGTEAIGNFFQVSNQLALGHSENDLIDKIGGIVDKLVKREESTRSILMAKNKEEMVDKIWRAYGTLKSARIITSAETIKLLSTIRLGVDLDIVGNVDKIQINELFILTQPAHLQKMEGKLLTPNQRDYKRADLIRERLKGEK